MSIKWRYLQTILCLLLACKANAVGRCERAFIPVGRLSIEIAGEAVRQIDWARTEIVRIESNLRPGPSGEQRKLQITRFDAEVEGGNHHFAHTYSIRPSATAWNRYSWSADAALSLFREAKNRALEFVFENYRKRREHWSPEFIEKLRKLADDFEDQSTYINIMSHEFFDSRPGYRERDQNAQLVGSMRLIREKDGRLPVEDYLGFTYRSNRDVVKIEPGNFAIEPNASDIAWSQLSIAIITQMSHYRAEFNRDPIFLTYADSYSERLYKGLGFKHVPRSELDLRLSRAKIADHEGGVLIDRDGVKWTPMYATEKMMKDLLEAKLKKIASRNGGTTVARGLRRYLTKSLKLEASPFWSSKAGVVVQSNSTRVNPVGTPAVLEVRRKGNNATFFIRASLQRTHPDIIMYESVTVPIPIPENYRSYDPVTKTSIEYHKVERNIGEVVGRLRWKKIDDLERSEDTVELDVDPLLTHPVSSRVTSARRTPGRPPEIEFDVLINF